MTNARKIPARGSGYRCTYDAKSKTDIQHLQAFPQVLMVQAEPVHCLLHFTLSHFNDAVGEKGMQSILIPRSHPIMTPTSSSWLIRSRHISCPCWSLMKFSEEVR